MAAPAEAEAFIAGAAAPLRFAVRAAGARSEDRWAVAQREDLQEAPRCADQWVAAPLSARAGVPQCAGREAPGPLWARPEVQQYVDRWVAALLWVGPAMLQCVDPPATWRSAAARTSIADLIRTFMVAPIMVPALSRQVSPQAPLLVPPRPPHTILRTIRSPITKLLVALHTRRTQRTAPTPIKWLATER